MSGMVSGGGPGSQDFDINLAPIIDCFTVLIAFMLATAAFLSIGILDAGISAAGATAATNQPPTLQVTLELQEVNSKQKIIVKTAGKSTSSKTLESLPDGTWNYDELDSTLNQFKAAHSDLSAITLSADNAIEYKHVIKTMERIRKTIPVVLLGGF